MSDETQDPTGADEWPTHCQECGTELTSAVLDFDDTKANRPEMRPGEMVAVEYCPNPTCPSHRTEGQRLEDTPTGPGSLGGDNGGG